MSSSNLSEDISKQIKVLASKAVGALSPSSAAWEFARRGAIRPVEYMRYAEFDAVLRDLVLAPGMTVLDISSPQWFSIYLAHKQPGVRIIYTNIIDSELDPFREIAAILKLSNLEYRKADARALEYPDGTFDKVISISVLEHIYPEVGGDTQALKEIARVLKPAGEMLLTTPYKSQRNIVYKDEAVYERNEKKRNFFAREYDEKMFDELIASSPFSVNSAWFICEKAGVFALDYYEWGPGRDVLIAKYVNKARRLLERSLGTSLDATLAHRYLDVSRSATGRLVNIAARLTRP